MRRTNKDRKRMVALQALHDVPLNTTDIPQSRLNIENKSRSNLFPWKGQFSPQLVEALLASYATTDSTLFDPFLGSGTVLGEAGRRGIAAIGCEINPAAYCMARTYQFINLANRERKLAISRLDGLLESAFPGPWFGDSGAERPLDITGLHDLASGLDLFSRILFDALIIKLDLFKGTPSPDRVSSVWSDLTSLVLSLPHSREKVEALNSDARATSIPGASVDLVISSPPYVNVFNYHQQYRLSAESLGWDLLHVARSEIGSNRKHRGNRFLTVTQYCLDIAQVLQEVARVCRASARIILVVGRESNVRKTRFYNGSMVTGLAKNCGFTPLTRQERVFRNRFGQDIFEDILHFAPPVVPRGADLVAPRAFAREVLVEATERTPAGSREDLRSAIERINEVMPSPLYERLKSA